MAERPYSRYTRERTWAALYSQCINAGYALVPGSATNNSIAVIRCDSAEKTQHLQGELIKHEKACEDFFATKKPLSDGPDFLKMARWAVVLAKSSDYHHYHLADATDFKLVICGLHDSYLHVVVWETRMNRRYGARETAVTLGSPEFEKKRQTQFGHNVLLGALVCGDKTALAYLLTMRPSTQRRIRSEYQQLQEKQYQGRPLAFLTEAERQERGAKISEGLKRYHAQKRLKVV